MSRFILLIVLAGFITYSIVSMTQNKNVTLASENAVNNYVDTKVRNAANSTVQTLMSRVADDYDWRVISPVTENLFESQVTYTVTDEIFDDENLIKYSVTVDFYGTTKQVTAYSDKFPFIPPSIKGAITANNPVNTEGDITIDGRNHTSLGNLVPETGSYAIWTTGTYTQGGTTDIGGTHQKIDYVPSNPGDPNVILENQSWLGGFPDSPDQVMGGTTRGFPEGTLKSIAQSGINGSQYVTDPDNLNGNPLSGVTYVELPTNFPWNQWMNMDITGTGVLVVHNSAKNSVMKNLVTGTFTGIIIVDDMVHVYGTVIGTIVVLTPNPSDGTCIGNGQGKVLYSTECIFDALTTTNLEKRMFNYGFGKNRLYVKHWFE